MDDFAFGDNHPPWNRAWNEDYKYDDVTDDTKQHNRTIWYITNPKKYQFKYSTSSEPDHIKPAKVEQIISSKEFEIHRIDITLNKQQENDTIFLEIYKLSSNKTWEQVTHINAVGIKYSNHPISKTNNDKYAWKIGNDKIVYLLDRKAKESKAVFFKTKHNQYYINVINNFMTHLYDNVNKKYSPYLVIKTLEAIYELLTDKNQLNWSYVEDEPVQIFITSLQSTFTFTNIEQITNQLQSKDNVLSSLVSLVTILYISHKQNEQELDSMNASLQLIYDHITNNAEYIDLVSLLFSNDTKLMSQIQKNLLLKGEMHSDCCIKPYYYLLWYNLICRNTEITQNLLTNTVEQEIVKTKLNLDDLLCIIKLDQRLYDFQNKPFSFTVLLMDKVVGYLKEMKSNQRQDTFFDVINSFKDLDDLYHILVKSQSFIFDTIIIESNHELWLKFVDDILSKMNELITQNNKEYNDYNQLRDFILNKFCPQIVSISNQQIANKLWMLYCSQKQFMDCSLARNAILQNEYLIVQKKFISICTPNIRSMDTDSLRKYLDLWLGYMCWTDIFEIFESNELDWKVLANYLKQYAEENEKLKDVLQHKNDSIATLKQQLKTENESFKVRIGEFKEEIEFLKQKQMEFEEKKEKHVNDNYIDNEVNEDKEKFKLWLINKVKLPEYLKLFTDHNSDDFRIIKYFDQSSLQQIGISNIWHRQLIIQEVVKEIDNVESEGSTPYV